LVKAHYEKEKEKSLCRPTKRTVLVVGAKETVKENVSENVSEKIIFLSQLHLRMSMEKNAFVLKIHRCEVMRIGILKKNI